MQSIFLKYKKYYENVPILYCIALYLDHWVKILKFHRIIESLYETLDFDENTVIRQLKIKKPERKKKQLKRYMICITCMHLSVFLGQVKLIL
jgi:hypothetical protein